MCLRSPCEWDVALPFQACGPAARGRTPGPACWRPGRRSAGVPQTGLHSCRVCPRSSLIKALYRREGMWVKHCTGLWPPGSLSGCQQTAASQQARCAARPHRAGDKTCFVSCVEGGGVGFGERGEFPLWEGVLGEQVFPSSFQGSRLTLKACLPRAGQLQVHRGRESVGRESLRTSARRAAAPSRPLPCSVPHRLHSLRILRWPSRATGGVMAVQQRADASGSPARGLWTPGSSRSRSQDSRSLCSGRGGSQPALICGSCSVRRWAGRTVTQVPPPGHRAGSSPPQRPPGSLPSPAAPFTAPSPPRGSCQDTAPVPGPRVSAALWRVTRARSRGRSLEALGTAGKHSSDGFTGWKQGCRAFLVDPL